MCAMDRLLFRLWFLFAKINYFSNTFPMKLVSVQYFIVSGEISFVFFSGKENAFLTAYLGESRTAWDEKMCVQLMSVFDEQNLPVIRYFFLFTAF